MQTYNTSQCLSNFVNRSDIKLLDELNNSVDLEKIFLKFKFYRKQMLNNVIQIESYSCSFEKMTLFSLILITDNFSQKYKTFDAFNCDEKSCDQTLRHKKIVTKTFVELISDTSVIH